MGNKISKVVLLNNCSQRDYQNLKEVIIEAIKAGKTEFTFWGMKGRIEGQVIEAPEECLINKGEKQ